MAASCRWAGMGGRVSGGVNRRRFGVAGGRGGVALGGRVLGVAGGSVWWAACCVCLAEGRKVLGVEGGREDGDLGGLFNSNGEGRFGGGWGGGCGGGRNDGAGG